MENSRGDLLDPSHRNPETLLNCDRVLRRLLDVDPRSLSDGARAHVRWQVQGTRVRLQQRRQPSKHRCGSLASRLIPGAYGRLEALRAQGAPNRPHESGCIAIKEWNLDVATDEVSILATHPPHHADLVVKDRLLANRRRKSCPDYGRPCLVAQRQVVVQCAAADASPGHIWKATLRREERPCRDVGCRARARQPWRDHTQCP